MKTDNTPVRGSSWKLNTTVINVNRGYAKIRNLSMHGIRIEIKPGVTVAQKYLQSHLRIFVTKQTEDIKLAAVTKTLTVQR
jgi:hypothetical protein